MGYMNIKILCSVCQVYSLCVVGVPLDENSKEYKREKKKCEGKLKKMFKLMRAVMSIPIFKYVCVSICSCKWACDSCVVTNTPLA